MNTIEEGDHCQKCNAGRYYLPQVEGCCCHVNPPCYACTNNRLRCDECGEEKSKPEYVVPPIPTQAQINAWAERQRKWEESRQRGHTFPSGGRIYNMSYDGSSGSTMVFKGNIEGPVTADEIREYLGDGTFGHRGPLIYGNQFKYTKITD